MSLVYLEQNAIFFLITLVSIVAIALFIERLMALSKAEMHETVLLEEVKKALEVEDIPQALVCCEHMDSVLARVLEQALMRTHMPQSSIEHAMFTAGKLEIAALEKNAKILSMLAHITPLLGLLGTVLGFIDAFSHMRQKGLVDMTIDSIGQAMEMALVTTAFGLTVAIPCILGYNYLQQRIEHLVLRLEASSTHLLELLKHRGP